MPDGILPMSKLTGLKRLPVAAIVEPAIRDHSAGFCFRNYFPVQIVLMTACSQVTVE